MNIEMINVNKIKPDPNQPRKTIDEERVKEMALSIKTEGIINPIEVDENNIIITGEMRWRSAKEAGLKKVPCKVMKLTGDLRFRRQVIENIQHNTMTVWDTATAIKKLIERKPGLQSYSDIGNEIGKSKMFIADMLSLMEESGKTKQYLKSKDSKYTHIRSINQYIPEEYKERVVEKLMNGEISGREIIEEIGRAIRRNPEKAEELLGDTYRGVASEEIKKIQSKSPVVDVVKEMDKGSKVLLAMNSLVEVLQKISPDTIPDMDKNRVEIMADKLIKVLSNYRKNNLIEGEIV